MDDTSTRRNSLLITAVKHPQWFFDVLRVGWQVFRQQRSPESIEDGLKLAARKHGVDYHDFD